jgi:hypothetical protein
MEVAVVEPVVVVPFMVSLGPRPSTVKVSWVSTEAVTSTGLKIATRVAPTSRVPTVRFISYDPTPGFVIRSSPVTPTTAFVPTAIVTVALLAIEPLPLESVIAVAVVVAPQVAPEGSAASVTGEPFTVRSISPKSIAAMPPKEAGNVMTIVPPAATPFGVLNERVWFETTLGAESDKVSLNDVTFAASAKRKDVNPIDHKMVARANVAAVAWSNENEVLVILMFLYVVLAYSLYSMHRDNNG